MSSKIKILGLNGSPRPYGATFKLLRIALETAKKLGAEVEELNLYEYRIEDCLGCVSDERLACRYPCVIDDDMKIIYDKILRADGVIFATPIYWFSPSGIVKRVIDRLTAFENMIRIDGKSWVEGKVAGVIAVGNDSGEIQVISLMFSILNSIGFIIPPFALAYHARMEDVLENKSAVLDAANVGRSVFLMAKLVREFKEAWYDVSLELWLKKELLGKVREEAEKIRRKVFNERVEVITKLMKENETK